MQKLNIPHFNTIVRLAAKIQVMNQDLKRLAPFVLTKEQEKILKKICERKKDHSS